MMTALSDTIHCQEKNINKQGNRDDARFLSEQAATPPPGVTVASRHDKMIKLSTGIKKKNSLDINRNILDVDLI